MDTLAPEQVVRAAFAALDQRDWRTLVTLIDPAALPHVKERALMTAHAIERHQPPTVDDYARQHPSMPREVAEWFVSRRESGAAEEAASLSSLRVRSLAELESLSAEDVFVRWMAGMDERERNRRARYGSESSEADRSGEHSQPRRQVIGCVYEGEGLAHVLYRSDEAPWPPILVESLSATASGWRLGLNGLVSIALQTPFDTPPAWV